MNWKWIAAGVAAIAVVVAVGRKKKTSHTPVVFYFGPEWPQETWPNGTLLIPIRTKDVDEASLLATDLIASGDAISELQRRYPQAAGRTVILAAFSAGGWALDPLLVEHAHDDRVVGAIYHDAAFGTGRWPGLRRSVSLARSGALPLLVITTGPHPNAKKAVEPAWREEAPDAAEEEFPENLPAPSGTLERSGRASWYDVPSLSHSQHKTRLAPWLWEKYLGR